MKSIQPIAKISSTHGLAGNVKLRPLSRYFDDYIECEKLMVGDTSTKSREIHLDMISGLGKARFFKFKGIDSLSDAKKILGKTLYTQAEYDDEINLISRELLGFTVITITHEIIGTLSDVMWLPSNDVYLIKNNFKEYLIPIIPEIIKKVDYSKMQIVIEPIDGLID